MARRKKKARMDKPAGAKATQPRAAQQAQQASSSQGAAEAPSGKQKVAPRGRGRSVSMPTCLAGMFLTLVLGLYLGTLMPGVTNALRGPTGETAPNMPEKSAEKAMEPRLAAMIATLERKSQENPDSATDWINLGNVYFDANEPEKAIHAYERALKLAPNNADTLTDLGIMYRETGNFERAIECFHKASAINPQHEPSLYNEGVVYSQDLKQNDLAIKAWQRLLDLNPQARAPNGTPVATMIRELQ